MVPHGGRSIREGPAWRSLATGTANHLLSESRRLFESKDPKLVTKLNELNTDRALFHSWAVWGSASLGWA
jgi:hypothetical protein